MPPDANTPSPQTEAPDPFMTAFEYLSSLGDDASQADVDRSLASETPAAGAAQEQPVQGQPVQGQPVEEQPVEEEQPTAEPATSDDGDDDLIRRLGALLRKEPPPAAPEPAPAPTAAPAAPELPPVYNKDEEEFLSTYEKEWPEVARAEALRRRAEYRELTTFIFKEVADFLRPHLGDLQAVAARTHLSELEQRVPDYDDVRDKVITWVGEQPKYLQAAYQHVIQQGTADEVADLISRWRAATGVTPTPAPRARETTALPPATKQAAAALAPVGSKRSATAAGVDPADFDGAFAAAVAGRD